jgi:hypothetical protein
MNIPMDPFNNSGRIAAPQYLSLSSLLVNNLSCTERSVWGKEGALSTLFQADIWVPAAIPEIQASDILAIETFILFGSITLNGNLIARQDVAPTVSWAEQGTSIGIITEATASLLGTNVNNTDMCGSFTFVSAGGGTVGNTANDIEVTVTYDGTYVKPPVPILNVWFSDVTDAQSWLGAGLIEVTSFDEVGFTVTFLGDGVSSIWSAGSTITLVWHSQGLI